MKEIALNKVDEKMWISDVGNLNFGSSYACKVRCFGFNEVVGDSW